MAQTTMKELFLQAISVAKGKKAKKELGDTFALFQDRIAWLGRNGFNQSKTGIMVLALMWAIHGLRKSTPGARSVRLVGFAPCKPLNSKDFKVPPHLDPKAQEERCRPIISRFLTEYEFARKVQLIKLGSHPADAWEQAQQDRLGIVSFIHAVNSKGGSREWLKNYFRVNNKKPVA